MFHFYNDDDHDNDNNNNNIHVSIAPYGLTPNFRLAGSRSDHCSVNACMNKKVLNLDFKTLRE